MLSILPYELAVDWLPVRVSNPIENGQTAVVGDHEIFHCMKI